MSHSLWSVNEKRKSDAVFQSGVERRAPDPGVTAPSEGSCARSRLSSFPVPSPLLLARLRINNSIVLASKSCPKRRDTQTLQTL